MTRSTRRHRRTVSVISVVATLGVLFCAYLSVPSLGGFLEELAGTTDSTAAPTTTAAPLVPSTSSTSESPANLTMSGDYVTILGTAEELYTPTQTGVVQYCPLDSLRRAVCAYGELTASLREKARAADRQDINVDPSGWNTNSEVTIPALPGISGSESYNGWFWNRSHLVADSLGGDAIVENLVTGTRTQNVGSTQQGGQYAGGMAYTELLARNYLDSAAAKSCPLYYAATPVYSGNELIPRSVIVDIQSCDKSIDQRVQVSNTANGWSIDYADGTFTQQ